MVGISVIDQYNICDGEPFGISDLSTQDAFGQGFIAAVARDAAAAHLESN